MPQQFIIPAGLAPYTTQQTVVVRSPGRINLIGEHTDYNNGFVLPAAIDKAAYIAITPRADREIHLYAIDLNDQYETSVGELLKSGKSWPNYILGVVQQFALAGIPIGGFDAALSADIPIGAGLSSSAAVECATAVALNELFNAGFDKLTLVKMAQKAENEFVGVQCGIMDQFASMFGRHNHAIRLDCRSLQYEYVPFNMDGIKIVLLDTNVKHSLDATQYNVRRNQCESGVAMIQRHIPGVESLRDVTMPMLDQYVMQKEPLIYRRCKYVVEENNRLLDACKELERSNLAGFGEKMFASHEGLSKLYEVSCPELDFLADYVRSNPAVLGARMMGGGFGGCTINLVKDEAVEELITQTSIAYKKAMNRELTAHIAKIETGNTIIKP